MAASAAPPPPFTTCSLPARGAPGTGCAPTRSGITTTAGRSCSTGSAPGPLRLDRLTPQAVVPAGVWQAAEPEGEAVLCGCTVAPGFEFEDFEIGSPETLAAEFPSEAALIRRLGR